jgi:hypothetical protein
MRAAEHSHAYRATKRLAVSRHLPRSQCSTPLQFPVLGAASQFNEQRNSIRPSYRPSGARNPIVRSRGDFHKIKLIANLEVAIINARSILEYNLSKLYSLKARSTKA